MTWLLCPYCQSPTIYRIAISQPTMDHIIRDNVHPQTKMTRVNADHVYRADLPIPSITVGYCGDCHKIWAPIDLTSLSDLCSTFGYGGGTVGPQGPPGPQGPAGQDGDGPFYVTTRANSLDPSVTSPLFVHRQGDTKTHVHIQDFSASTLNYTIYVGVDKTGTLGLNGWVYFNNWLVAP